MESTEELAGKAKRYIENNLNPQLSVKVIAVAMNTNAPDLDRQFRRATGVTIKKYIDAKCKEQILERLLSQRCKGCALAQEFGFRTDQAFYRWVQRVFAVRFRDLSAQSRSKSEKM